MKKILFCLILIITTATAYSEKVLIPMDLSQTDHLKAYGITFWWLTDGGTGEWLLNYRSGSFLFDYDEDIITECQLRGVDYEVISDANAEQIYAEVQDENANMDVIRLEKAPRIAVYVPPTAQPWDDAVRLVLEYAEVPYTPIWDEEVLNDKLKDFDWIHLHHEDFTGQYGKFWLSYANTPWYITMVTSNQNMAEKLGYAKVSKMKLAVAQKMREYVASGGFLFAMCSATDSYDIALAAQNTDICPDVFDGDPVEPNDNQKLNYDNTFAFQNFKVINDPSVYEFSDIDIPAEDLLNTEETDYFTLFDFSAKYDPVPTMLTQNHANVIKGFVGQTSAFHREFIKPSVTILGEREGTDQVKYIYGKFGRGFFTWYGGHDPEDYTHKIGDPATDVSLHKNSPGYRLILNNILFPAAKKKKQKT